MMKGIAFNINSDSWVPRSANEDPPCRKDTTPANKSAATKASIAAESNPTPARTFASTIFEPSINGIALVMNCDRHKPS